MSPEPQQPDPWAVVSTKPLAPDDPWAVVKTTPLSSSDKASQVDKTGPVDVVTDAVEHLSRGALKATGRTAVNLATAAAWLMGIKDATDPTTQLIKQAIGKPQGTMENIGALAADAATALVPAGAISEAAQGAKALAGGAGMLGTGAKALVNAAGSGGIAALQDQSPVIGAIAGGAGSLASDAAGAVANKLKQSATGSMIAAMGPAGRGTGPAGSADLAMAKKVAPGLLERNFSALSHEGALAKVGTAIQAADDHIDDVMARIPEGTKVPTQPIINVLQAAKKAGQVGGVPVGTGMVSNDVLDTVIDQLKQQGPMMSPDDAVKFRQLIGPLGKWSALQTPAENTKAEAYQTAYNGIRGAIEHLDSDIAGANKEMSFWLNVQKVLQKASQRPQAPSSGTSGAVLGAIAEGAKGASTGSVLSAAFVGRQLQRLARSPGWRFVSANVKDDLAKFIQAGDFSKIMQVVANVASHAGGSE